MKSTRILLVVAMLMGCSTLAFAAGTTEPVWPWGTNPATAQPVNGFCDSQQAILDNSLLSALPPEFTGLLSYLAPATGDINGTSYVIKDPLTFSLNGNGMLDCSIELKLVEEVLRDQSFSVGSLTHSLVFNALVADNTQFGADVGMYWGLLGSLANGLQQVLLGHMIIGDGDATFSDPVGDPPDFNRVDSTGSAGFIKAVMFLLGSNINNAYIDLANYQRLPQFFSKEGDADSDGASNACEYQYYSGAGTYVANALNPAVHPTAAECNFHPNFGFASTFGAGWYEAGAPITLGVVVENFAGTVSFSWAKNGIPISGETNASLTIASAQESDSGTYRCTATDASKAVISADLTVLVVAAGSLPVAGILGVAALLTAVVGAGAAAVRKARKA